MGTARRRGAATSWRHAEDVTKRSAEQGRSHLGALIAPRLLRLSELRHVRRMRLGSNPQEAHRVTVDALVGDVDEELERNRYSDQALPGTSGLITMGSTATPWPST